MIKNIQEYTYIKNSLNQSFIFYMDDEHHLVFDALKANHKDTNARIVESNVIDFSANMDKNDQLHLIYLLGNGELIYSRYLNEAWQKNLVRKLDTKSNTYKYLNLLLHENHTNIFYAFTNLINANLWTIEHITKDSTHWKKKTVTNIFSEKNFTPFCLDQDKFGNIFLVYRGKEYTKNHIYYAFYNIFAKEWFTTLTKISSPETDNILPYLFIDSQNNIHVLWYCLDNSDYFITYKYLSLTGQNKYHWSEIQLPEITNFDYTPIMSEKNNQLNIICITQDEIYCLISKNHGRTWNIENKIAFNKGTVHRIKYFSNILSNNKINHCYGSADDNNIYFYFDENLDKKRINDLLPPSTLDNKEPSKDHLINQEEEISIKNIETQQLAEPEETFTSLKEVINTVNAIKNDIEFIKEKIIDLEKNQNTKKGFFMK